MSRNTNPRQQAWATSVWNCGVSWLDDYFRTTTWQSWIKRTRDMLEQWRISSALVTKRQKSIMETKMATHRCVAKLKYQWHLDWKTELHPTTQHSTDETRDPHEIQNTQCRFLQFRHNLDRDKWADSNHLRKNIKLRLHRQQHKRLMTSELPM